MSDRLSFPQAARAAMDAAPADLSPSTRLILTMLQSFADPDGAGIYVGTARLGELAGMTARTVLRHLRVLKARGLLSDIGIRRHGRRCHTTLRRLNLASCVGSGAAAEDAADRQAEAMAEGGEPAGQGTPAEPEAAREPVLRSDIGVTSSASEGGIPAAPRSDASVMQTMSRKKEREASESARASRPGKSKFPEDWRPDAEGVQFALDAGIADPMRAAAKFSAWHRSEGTERADWRAAWERWCLDEPRFQDGGGRRPAREKYRNGFLTIIEAEGMPSMAEDADEEPDNAVTAFIARHERRMTDSAAAGGNHG